MFDLEEDNPVSYAQSLEHLNTNVTATPLVVSVSPRADGLTWKDGSVSDRADWLTWPDQAASEFVLDCNGATLDNSLTVSDQSPGHLNTNVMPPPQVGSVSPPADGLTWQDQAATVFVLDCNGATLNNSLTFSDRPPMSPGDKYFNDFFSQLPPQRMLTDPNRISYFNRLRYPSVNEHLENICKMVLERITCAIMDLSVREEGPREKFVLKSLTYPSAKRMLNNLSCTLIDLLVRKQGHLENLVLESLSLCITREGCLLEATFGEIINQSADGKLDLRLPCMQICEPAGSQSGPEALPDGEMIQVDKLQLEEIVECDATNNGGNVGGEGSSLTTITLSKKNKRKKSERKCTTDKSIDLVDLQQYGMTREAAAKILGVSISTFKRRCRENGISRWPSHKINKDKQSLSTSTRKGVTKSVLGAEGSHNPTSLGPNLLAGAVGTVSSPSSLNGSHQGYVQGSKPPELWGKNNESFSYMTLDNGRWVEEEEEKLGMRAPTQTKLIHKQICFSPPEFGKDSNSSKMKNGSKEGRTWTLTSHDVCLGNSIKETPPAMASFISPTHKECIEVGSFPELAFVPTDSEPQRPLGGAGSSKNLSNFLPSAAEADLEGQISESGCTDLPCSDPASKQAMATLSRPMPYVGAKQATRFVTFKADYGKDTKIRFDMSSTSGIDELNEEVTKRLKLEANTFSIKYLDDDGDWILIACDEDLQASMNISSSLANNKIILLVHDKIDNSRNSS